MLVINGEIVGTDKPMKYNGNDVTKIVVNGEVVWEKVTVVLSYSPSFPSPSLRQGGSKTLTIKVNGVASGNYNITKQPTLRGVVALVAPKDKSQLTLSARSSSGTGRDSVVIQSTEDPSVTLTIKFKVNEALTPIG